MCPLFHRSDPIQRSRMQLKPTTHLIPLIILAVIAASCADRPEKLEPTYIEADGLEDIYHFEDSLIKPVDYLHLVSLEPLPTEERKITFIHQLLPSILICKYNLELQQRYLEKLLQKDSVRLSRKHKQYLDSLYLRYRTRDPEELLKRLDTHPVSIILAQAALESAWGTSRFFMEGNNVFGIWSFSASDKRMASKGIRNGEPVFLKKYRTLSEAVEDYFLVLARGPFEDFRVRRTETENPYVLVDFLRNYSEKEEEYASMLRTLIRNNDLTRFDNYQLDPKFIRFK